MKIFCDTNIIIEFLQERQQAPLVRRILMYAASSRAELCISFGSFYTITYLVEGYLKKDKRLQGESKLIELREILNGILDSFQLIGANDRCFKKGVNDLHFSDLEDSYQAHIAEEFGCDVLLTINRKHFEQFANSSTMPVLTPQDFIDAYLN